MVILSQKVQHLVMLQLRVVVIDLHSSLGEQELGSRQLFPLEERVSEIEMTVERGKQRQIRSKNISKSSHLIKIRQDKDLGTKLLLVVEEEERCSMAQVRLK